jgi:hypothetical protein
MAKRGRPRKKTPDELVDDRKRSRKLFPGPWSDIKPNFTVMAKLVKNRGLVSSLPDHLGKYVTHNDGYEGSGYRAYVKITTDNFEALVEKHGLDDVLAACEKSFNSYRNKNKRKILGDFVIEKVLYDEKSRREKDYVPCLVKTNRKYIKKFMGTKYGELQVF